MLITLKIWKGASFKNVSFWVLLLQFCFVFGQKKVIVFDPGHGGKDPGAIGVNGIQEKDVVFNIAKEVLALNKDLFDDRLDIYLTRHNDTLISLKDRSRLTRELKADVFVSLHCNASSRSSRGVEVYTHTSKDGKSHIKGSIAMGLSILKESTGNLGLKERSVKFANFQVLRETIAYCPSVLVEMGFVTNIDEAGYFLKPENIRAMALAILMGLYDYLNIRL